MKEGKNSPYDEKYSKHNLDRSSQAGGLPNGVYLMKD
jgi:hypothetical protein